MSFLRIVLLVGLLSGFAKADDDTPDIAFLEWLGQASEVEEMGVDINKLLDETEEKAQSENAEKKL